LRWVRSLRSTITRFAAQYKKSNRNAEASNNISQTTYFLQEITINAHTPSTKLTLQYIKHTFTKDFYEKSPIFLYTLEIKFDNNHNKTKETIYSIHIIAFQ
jgi:hypothetical protein